MSRRDELAGNLAATQGRLARACEAAGRSPDEVTLIVVTKTYPASDVVLLAELGVTDVGENRHPEAARKQEEVSAAGASLRWHFVGGLQSNKAAAVARYADAVHSVDRLSLVDRLATGAQAAGRLLDCFAQVDLAGVASDDGRAGCAPDDVGGLADAIAAAAALNLRGVMTVAPLDAEPAAAFAELGRLSKTVRATHPDAAAISAGMSGDLEAAVAAGATHVRIGRAVLGERPPLG